MGIFPFISNHLQSNGWELTSGILSEVPRSAWGQREAGILPASAGGRHNPALFTFRRPFSAVMDSPQARESRGREGTPRGPTREQSQNDRTVSRHMCPIWLQVGSREWGGQR